MDAVVDPQQIYCSFSSRRLNAMGPNGVFYPVAGPIAGQVNLGAPGTTMSQAYYISNSILRHPPIVF